MTTSITFELAETASLLGRYLRVCSGGTPNIAAIAFYALLDHVHAAFPDVAEAIISELLAQDSTLRLIASENYCSLAVQFAQGTLLTDKYAEGSIGHRFYAGCENVDTVEREAVGLARELFNADHAYVQPHSGADANLVAFLAVLNAKVRQPLLDGLDERDPTLLSAEEWATVRSALNGQRLLALDYYSGGHLTHGYRHNLSAQLFDVHTYSVSPATHRLEVDDLRRRLREVRPLVFLVGYSAYSRKIDFAQMRELADEVGATLMVDMAHFAGLVAGKVFRGNYDPVSWAHIVTSTTHKTLRGPRGGFVLCQRDLAGYVDKGCPSILGGPLPHVMAAKALAFREALQPSFREYAQQIVNNASQLADACRRRGMHVLTGGTDNHMVLLDVSLSFGLTGRQAESALRASGLTVNRNALPFDTNGPWYTSGLRLGSAALTTRGFSPSEMDNVAECLALVLSNTTPHSSKRAQFSLPEHVAKEAATIVRETVGRHPLYPELNLTAMFPERG